MSQLTASSRIAAGRVQIYPPSTMLEFLNPLGGASLASSGNTAVRVQIYPPSTMLEFLTPPDGANLASSRHIAARVQIYPGEKCMLIWCADSKIYW